MIGWLQAVVARWEAYAQGRIDAAEYVPGDQATAPSPWVFERVARSERTLQRMLERWEVARRKHDARLHCAAEVSADRQLRFARAEESEHACAARLADLHHRAGALHHELNGGHATLPGWAYAISLVLLAAAEWPLIYLSFTAFGLAPVSTGLLATLCAALSSLLGHSMGAFTRRLGVGLRAVTVMLALVAAAFLGSLAWLRESAFHALTDDLGSLDPQAAALALFAVSLASVLVAALLAWHHRLEPLAAELARARRNLAHSRRERIAGARALRRARKAEHGARAHRDAARDRYFRRAGALAAWTHGLLQVYVRSNVRYRESREAPPGLVDEVLPRVRIPPELWPESDPSDMHKE